MTSKRFLINGLLFLLFWMLLFVVLAWMHTLDEQKQFNEWSESMQSEISDLSEDQAKVSEAISTWEGITEIPDETFGSLWSPTETTEHLVDLGTFKITAYCSCEICCGKWAKNRPNGIVYTANGSIAEQGVTIAVDPSVIPYGSIVEIEGVGRRVAQDCGGHIKGNRIDIYFSNHQEALDWTSPNGYHNLRVWLVETP